MVKRFSKKFSPMGCMWEDVFLSVWVKLDEILVWVKYAKETTKCCLFGFTGPCVKSGNCEKCLKFWYVEQSHQLDVSPTGLISAVVYKKPLSDFYESWLFSLLLTLHGKNTVDVFVGYFLLWCSMYGNHWPLSEVCHILHTLNIVTYWENAYTWLEWN